MLLPRIFYSCCLKLPEKTMHTHRLQLPKHQHFLDEKRHDPVTGDKFQEGDELVFCANSGSDFPKNLK